MQATTMQEHGPVMGATDAMLDAAPIRIGEVELVAHDLDRLVDFYASGIGLRIVDRSGNAARMGVGDRTLIRLRRDATARRSTPRDAGLFHTAFLLPERADLSAWIRHAAGARLALAGASDHLVSEALYLADPEGNGVEIYVDRPASDWPYTVDGDVAMATERLDLSSLAGASDRPWSGFPAGGRIGHVHLRVGELAPAEAFYTGVLGFGITCRYPGGIFFGAGGYHHQLAANVWNSLGAPTRSGSVTGLREVELVVSPGTLAEARVGAAPDAVRLDAPGRLGLVDPWGTPILLVDGSA